MMTTLAVVLTVSLAAMMSPGPDMMLIVKHSRAEDRWPALACVAGICAGLTVHVIFSIFGVAAVIAASSFVYSMIKYAGAAYLLYIGVQSLRSRGGLTIDRGSEWSSTAARAPFRDGFLCNILNPKVTLFMLAIFTQVLDPATSTVHKVMYGSCVVLEALLVWNVFVLLIRTQIVLRALQRYQIAIDRIVGTALIGLAGTLVVEDSRG